MKLYWAKQTRASRAVWMLEEAGVDYEIETVDLRAENRRDTPEFLAASPLGKVPALIDGDLAMADSAAICLYLADRYASDRLAPAIDDPQRGAFLYWLLYTPIVIEPAMSEKFHKLAPNKGRNGWGTFDVMLATLAARLADREWVMGDDFTAADVMLGSSAYFMRMFGMLGEQPVLDAYADRCLARPANQKAIALETS
jgi:glutathione S-transferase